MQFLVLIMLPLKIIFKGLLNRTAFKAIACVGAAALSSLAGGQEVNLADITRGAYLAKAGDCVACHTAGPQSPPFAGGLPIN
jgi:hypothetical protein